MAIRAYMNFKDKN